MQRWPKPSVVPHLAFAIKARDIFRIERLSRLQPISQPRTRIFPIYSSCRCATTSTRFPPQGRLPPRALKKDGVEEPDDTLIAGRAGRKVGVYLWGVCIFAFTVSMYITANAANHFRAVKATARLDLPQNSDVSNRWRDASRNFDEEVDLSEKWLLLRAKRKRLVNEAYGNVLEVSVGTGRNMDLYDLRPYDPKEDSSTGRSRQRIITSLTFNDQSEVMVDRAVSKFEQMENKRKKHEKFQGLVQFIVGDAGIKGVIDRPEGGYDTIIQTMGVCSVSDASGFLGRLGELCRQPGEASNFCTLCPKTTMDKEGRYCCLNMDVGFLA